MYFIFSIFFKKYYINIITFITFMILFMRISMVQETLKRSILLLKTSGGESRLNVSKRRNSIGWHVECMFSWINSSTPGVRSRDWGTKMDVSRFRSCRRDFTSFRWMTSVVMMIILMAMVVMMVSKTWSPNFQGVLIMTIMSCEEWCRWWKMLSDHDITATSSQSMLIWQWKLNK